MRKATSAECQNIQMQRGKALHQAALFSGSQAPWIWRDRGMLGLLHQHLDVWRCGATMKDEVLSFTAVSLTTTPLPFFICFTEIVFFSRIIFISVYVFPVPSPESRIPVWRRDWHRILEVRTLGGTGQAGQENKSLFLVLGCKIILIDTTDLTGKLKKVEDESVENHRNENHEDLFMIEVGHGEMNHSVNVRAGTAEK